jgi:putative endonuclease
VPDPRHDLGLRAEAAVASWLEAGGWSVLARRWRRPSGEIDLVCRDTDGCLVAVEVRLRRSARAGSPVESVDAKRLHRLRTALAAFAREHEERRELRVDLVSVVPFEPGSPRWRLTHHRGVDAW